MQLPPQNVHVQAHPVIQPPQNVHVPALPIQPPVQPIQNVHVPAQPIIHVQHVQNNANALPGLPQPQVHINHVQHQAQPINPPFVPHVQPVQVQAHPPHQNVHVQAHPVNQPPPQPMAQPQYNPQYFQPPPFVYDPDTVRRHRRRGKGRAVVTDTDTDQEFSMSDLKTSIVKSVGESISGFIQKTNAKFDSFTNTMESMQAAIRDLQSKNDNPPTPQQITYVAPPSTSSISPQEVTYVAPTITVGAPPPQVLLNSATTGVSNTQAPQISLNSMDATSNLLWARTLTHNNPLAPTPFDKPTEYRSASLFLKEFLRFHKTNTRGLIDSPMNLIEQYLTGKAQRWFVTHVAGTDKENDWKLFEEAFLLENKEQSSINILKGYRHRRLKEGESLCEYFEDMEKLFMVEDVSEREKMLAVYAGLPVKMVESIAVREPTTYKQLTKAAYRLQVDGKLFKSSKPQSISVSSISPTPTQKKPKFIAPNAHVSKPSFQEQQRAQQSHRQQVAEQSLQQSSATSSSSPHPGSQVPGGPPACTNPKCPICHGRGYHYFMGLTDKGQRQALHPADVPAYQAKMRAKALARAGADQHLQAPRQYDAPRRQVETYKSLNAIEMEDVPPNEPLTDFTIPKVESQDARMMLDPNAKEFRPDF